MLELNAQSNLKATKILIAAITLHFIGHDLSQLWFLKRTLHVDCG